MKKGFKIQLVIMWLAIVVLGVHAQSPTTTTIAATDGDIVITAMGHGSVQVEYAGTVVHVDPSTMFADYSKAKPADLVLVTDIHADHFDPKAIGIVRKAGAPVVMPNAVKEQMSDGTVLANGQTEKIAGVTIEAVAAYNLERGPKPGELFHTKGRGNGYVLDLGGKRLYLSGDTECVPEIKALKNIDVALMPMNLPYTMPPSELVECAKAFQPKILIPYHFRGQKPEEVVTALASTPIDVRVLNWYPTAP